MAKWIDEIKEKVARRVPELGEDANEFLCEDLIEECFREIVKHSGANSYKREWDYTLVRCVAALYNNIGVEGLLARSSLSTGDTFANVEVIAPIIVANIPQYIKPLDYVYSSTRFNLPQ